MSIDIKQIIVVKGGKRAVFDAAGTCIAGDKGALELEGTPKVVIRGTKGETIVLSEEDAHAKIAALSADDPSDDVEPTPSSEADTVPVPTTKPPKTKTKAKKPGLFGDKKPTTKK